MSEIDRLREPLLVAHIVFAEVERLIDAGHLEAAKVTLREFQNAIDTALEQSTETERET